MKSKHILYTLALCGLTFAGFGQQAAKQTNAQGTPNGTNTQAVPQHKAQLTGGKPISSFPPIVAKRPGSGSAPTHAGQPKK